MCIRDRHGGGEYDEHAFGYRFEVDTVPYQTELLPVYGKAVSYTHLDVYKRQDMQSTAIGVECFYFAVVGFNGYSLITLSLIHIFPHAGTQPVECAFRGGFRDVQDCG